MSLLVSLGMSSIRVLSKSRLQFCARIIYELNFLIVSLWDSLIECQVSAGNSSGSFLLKCQVPCPVWFELLYIETRVKLHCILVIHVACFKEQSSFHWDPLSIEIKLQNEYQKLIMEQRSCRLGKNNLEKVRFGPSGQVTRMKRPWDHLERRIITKIEFNMLRQLQ